MARPRVAAAIRFARQIEQQGDCWIWTGALTRHGYAQFSDGHVHRTYAHRWSYEFHRAQIPEGLHIDHLCRNRACVNPWHLEPVTPEVNTLRGEGVTARLARRTDTCERGHALPADRICLECSRIRHANYPKRTAS